MVNYACTFSQSESGKYFEWIIISFKVDLQGLLWKHSFIVTFRCLVETQIVRRLCTTNFHRRSRHASFVFCQRSGEIRFQWGLKFTVVQVINWQWLKKLAYFTIEWTFFFLHKHSPLRNSLYLFSLCQALGQCRQAKKRASSEIATERKMAGREKGKQPVSIFTNITVCPLPRSLHEKSFLVLKDRSSFVA